MQFLILGPLEVRNGEQTVRLGAAKQRALLGVLLLHANEAVSTSHLVDELWGERPPATAEKLVQGYVHALRKQLGGGLLETRAPGYRLSIEPPSLDLLEFERLAEEARAAAVADSIELRRRALALWRGPVLADVVLEGPERNTVARLSELRVATQIERIDSELQLGRHARLVGELEALVASHPYQERAVGLLMIALYRSGRQAEALEVYRAIRTRLDDELGLQPGQELRDLEAAILRQDEGLGLAEQAAADAPVSPPAAPPALEPPSAPRMTRRTLVGGAVAVGVAVPAAAAVAWALRRDPAPLLVGPNAVAVIDTDRNRVVDGVPVGTRPGPIAWGGDAIWVGNLDDKSLSRIDPIERLVVKNVQLPATPDAIAVGAGAVWVVNGRLGTMYRVDPSIDGGELTKALPLVSRSIFPGAGVDVGPDSVWAAFGDSKLARVDADPPRAAGLATTGNGPAAVLVAFDSVWVSNGGNANVQRFDPITFEEGALAEYAVGKGPAGMGAGADGVWIACADDDVVMKVEVSGAGAAPAPPVPVGDGPTAVAVSDAAVWVANTRDGTVSRVDPATNEVETTVTVGDAPSGLVAAGDSVWVTVQAP